MKYGYLYQDFERDTWWNTVVPSAAQATKGLNPWQFRSLRPGRSRNRLQAGYGNTFLDCLIVRSRPGDLRAWMAAGEGAFQCV